VIESTPFGVECGLLDLNKVPWILNGCLLEVGWVPSKVLAGALRLEWTPLVPAYLLSEGRKSLINAYEWSSPDLESALPVVRMRTSGC
jgi:hypothetical protein